MKKRRVVIKIGSSNIVKNEKIDEEKIGYLAGIISEYKSNKNIEFIIVTSGAVASGRERMKMFTAKLTIGQKQALAAIGQPYLMRKYKDAFRVYEQVIAQVLLTRDDLNSKKRYIHSRDTITELLNLNVIPIINENDTVSVDEIKIGDNDNLSAIVAAAVSADLLIILSDVDGLYNKNPKTNPDAVLVKEVLKITKEVMESAGGAGSLVGTGGMRTKIEAAKTAVKFGIDMIITNGEDIDNIKRILDGEDVGTRFVGENDDVSRKKRWIAFGLKPKGKIFIDEGARIALTNGKSLLASGIFEVEGHFGVGDSVIIADSKGIELGRGLVNYTSSDIEKIKKTKSSAIENILGYMTKEEVIHRDNMTLNEEK